MKTVFEIKATSELGIKIKGELTTNGHLLRHELADKRERIECRVFEMLMEEFGYTPREIKVTK